VHERDERAAAGDLDGDPRRGADVQQARAHRRH
jgi:hypothetical protein